MADSDDPGTLQTKLRAGIAAIRAGDRARGRDLLLEVVTADERVEPAWLWLSVTVDDPADALTALENALALNPHNTLARERRDALRAQLGLAEPQPAPPNRPAPPPAPPPTPNASRDFADQFAIDPDDDPLQCPYCGRLTVESETRCPHCRRSLLVPGRWQGSDYLYLLLIVLGLNVQGALVQAALHWGVTLLRGPWVERLLQLALLGDGLTSVPWPALASRSVLLFTVLALFLNDSRFAFPIAALVLALDVGVNGAAWALGLIPFPIAAFNLALSGLVLLISLTALLSQAISRQRRYTQLDRQLFDANGYYRRGREYLHAGLLALAALHFQKAVTLQPRTAQFYKALGLIPFPIAAFNLALSGLVLLISLTALLSQAISRQRRYTQLDRQLFDANGYYQRGREYLHAGLLALAALHFQKAVTLQPRTARFYKALGLTQARLGRFARAQQALEAGQSLAPDDDDFARILESIRDRT